MTELSGTWRSSLRRRTWRPCSIRSLSTSTSHFWATLQRPNLVGPGLDSWHASWLNNLPAKKFFETYRQDHTDLHDRDLQDLANVPDAHHIKEDQLCQRFLGTRYLLRMSRMAYSLYIQFITEQNLFQLTRLTHQHLGIRVTADSESKADGSAAGIGPIGESATQFSSTNQRKILLGRLPPDKGVFEEMQRRVKTRVDAGELDSEALERLKQLDPETAQGETAESSFRSPNRDRIPLPAR